MRRVIYGAGRGGRTLLRDMIEKGEDIAFFIDEFLDEPEVMGKEIRRIHQVNDASDIRLYFTLSPEHMMPEPYASERVTEYLGRMGFSDIIFWEEFMHDYAGTFDIWYQANFATSDYPAFLDKYYHALTHYEDAPISAENVRALKSLLSDETSVMILDRVLALRRDVRGEGPLLNLPEQYPHYFPKSIDLFRGIKALRFADCGAFNGDTIRDVMKFSRVPVSYTAPFEPDPRCFSDLQQETAKLKKAFPGTSFLTYSCGVWSENGLCYLSDGSESCAKVSEGDKGGNAIPVLSLDTALGNAPPNFVKYDVEGVEEAALLGTKEIIQRYHPTLAVSIYHNAHDLWELPQLIKSFYPKYEMYIRHHHWGPWETVLYCIAPDGAGVA